MARKIAFLNEMILKTLIQHQQTVPPAVQKAAALDDEVGDVLNRKKNINEHDKAKLYSDVLHKYLITMEQITPTGNLSPVVTKTTHLSMYNNESIFETVPKYTVSKSGNHGQ